MYKNANCKSEFMERTLANYLCLKEYGNCPYEVTQLINSTVGFLMIPCQYYESRVSNELVSDEFLQRLLAGAKKTEGYIMPRDLRALLTHMRNGVAHFRIEFESEGTETNEITHVIIKDRPCNGEKDNFMIRISVADLDLLLVSLSKGLLDGKKKHVHVA